MARLSKEEKRARMLLALLGGVAVGLLLILGIRAVLYYSSGMAEGVLAWLLRQAPIAAVPSETATSTVMSAIPKSNLSTPQAAQTLPLAATSSLSSATYTELFSGTGFEDAHDTTVYEDYVATAISFVPEFAVTSTSAAFTPPSSSAGGPAAAGAGVTEQADGTYTATIPAFPGLVVTSTYPGVLRFGYDVATGRTLVVYAAYESRVLEMGPTGNGGGVGLIADYSPRFGSRAFAGDTFGSRGVDPVIFAQDGAWWIFSGAGSARPRLIKIQRGAVIDYTQTAFSGASLLRAAPGPAPHEIYVKSNAGSYLFTDQGFKSGPAQWVSSDLNQWSGNVTMGEITSADASGTVEYFLSNNGGLTWFAADPGSPVTFVTAGSDFRYKALLVSDSADPYATPWVGTVRLAYWVQRAGL